MPEVERIVKPTVRAGGQSAVGGASAVPDERLVEQALAGERDAFEQLVRRHRRGLVNHLFRQTGQRDFAVDLAQEVFLKVYLSLDGFDPRYRFTTWLYRIASNCAIDHLRKRQPRTCPLQSDPLDDGADSGERAYAGSEPTPHEMLTARDMGINFGDAMPLP